MICKLYQCLDTNRFLLVLAFRLSVIKIFIYINIYIYLFIYTYIGGSDTSCYTHIAQHKAWRLSVAFTSRCFHQIDFPGFRSLFARLIMRVIISALQIM